MVFTAPKQLHSKLRSKKLFPLVSATKHKSSSSLVILNQVLGRTGELLLPCTHLPLSLVPCHSCPGKTLPFLDGTVIPPKCPLPRGAAQGRKPCLASPLQLCHPTAFAHLKMCATCCSNHAWAVFAPSFPNSNICSLIIQILI